MRITPATAMATMTPPFRAVLSPDLSVLVIVTLEEPPPPPPDEGDDPPPPPAPPLPLIGHQ